MSLNIGTLVGYLQLDDANFARKADNADRKINALKLHLEALGRENPKIGVEVTAQTAQLDLLKAKLADLKVQAESGVDVRVDAVQALIELDRVQTKIRELHGKTVSVKVDVDKSQISEGASALDNLGSKLGVLPALAVAAGAALIPVVGVITGLVAALAAPLAFAAGGVGLFALFGAAAVKQTEAQQTKITAAKKSLDAARQSLTNAQASAASSAARSNTSAQASADASIKSAKQAEAAATTAAGRHAAQQRIAAAEATLANRRASVASGTSASVASAQRRVNEALKAYQQELKGVSPAQQGFLSAMSGLKSTFSDILKGPTGSSVLTVLTNGIQLLAYLLRDAEPLIQASSSAFGTMLTELGQAVSSPGFGTFLDMVAGQIGTDMLAFAHILGNLAVGLGGLFGVLAGKHFSGSLLQDLTHLSREFAHWGNSSAARHDVRSLFEYVHKVGPQVGSTLGAIARGAGHLVKALAPLGPPTLKVIEGIADAISAIPVPVLTALAAAFVAITAAAKVGKALSFLSNVGTLGSLTSKGGVASLFSGGVQKVFVVNMEALGTGGSPVPVVGAGAKGLGSLVADAAGTGGVLSRTGGRLGAGLRRVGLGPEMIPIGLGSAPGQQSLFSRLFHGTQATSGLGNADDFLRATGQADAHLKSTTDHLDTLRAHAALASREIDLIGPNTKQAAGTGIQAIDDLQQHLNAVHDKKIAVILQDQAAIQSLEALQNLRLHDKFLTVFERSRMLDQAVGPGGGMGQHHAGGGEIRGAGSGVSDSVRVLGSNGEYVIRAAQYAANRPLVQAINNGSGRISLTSAAHARGMSARQVASGRVAMTITNWADGTGYIEDIASDVHEADHRYATAVRRPQ